MPPRITIITPSFQQATYLEECLRSVREQEGVEVEHIVVDGGSTDGSKPIIERNAGALKWWCSEPDGGQSDAINKGLAHTTGDVFTWVNSDDLLLPGALAHVAEAFNADPSLLAFGGRIVHRVGDTDETTGKLNDARDASRLFADPVINQPATFYRTGLVKAMGGVDPALRYVMDVELWWQLIFRHGIDHLRFDPVDLAVFRLHTESKTVSTHGGFLDELATLLHGMCIATGQGELARVFAAGHDLTHGLRGVPVEDRHAEIVRYMAVHFLLKWHGNVHHRRQFQMMKLFRRTVRIDGIHPLDPHLAKRWDLLEGLSGMPNWFAFRLRRKLRHLRT